MSGTILVMGKLKFSEKQSLEHVLGMKSGYVLDLSNADFAHMIHDATGIDVYTKPYEVNGTSKANRLRAFWTKEDAHTVANALEALLKREQRHPETYRSPPVNDLDREDCLAILDRLRSCTEVNNLPLLTVGNTHVTFARVREEVQRYIDEGRFQSGIDRLHTFVTHYLRLLVEKRSGSMPPESTPLHSLMGTYTKALQAGTPPTEMSLRILKSSISTLEAFNPIRNDQSLAHANEVTIGPNESRLIFSYVIALVSFIEEVERETQPLSTDDDIPF